MEGQLSMKRNLKKTRKNKSNQHTRFEEKLTKKMNFLPNIVSSVGKTLLRTESLMLGELERRKCTTIKSLIRSILLQAKFAVKRKRRLVVRATIQGIRDQNIVVGSVKMAPLCRSEPFL